MRILTLISLFSLICVQLCSCNYAAGSVGLRPGLGSKPSPFGFAASNVPAKQNAIDVDDKDNDLDEIDGVDDDGVDDDVGVPASTPALSSTLTTPSKQDMCVCPLPGQDLATVGGSKVTEQIKGNDTRPLRNKAVNLVLTSLKLALKFQLSSYNTMSGGFINRAIDKLIPTDPTPIDGMASPIDLMDPIKMGSVLLDQIVASSPSAAALVAAYKDPKGSAINLAKQELINRVPIAAAAIESWEDPGKIPQHLANYVQNGTVPAWKKPNPAENTSLKKPAPKPVDDDDDDDDYYGFDSPF